MQGAVCCRACGAQRALPRELQATLPCAACWVSGQQQAQNPAAHSHLPDKPVRPDKPVLSVMPASSGARHRQMKGAHLLQGMWGDGVL